jgi:hypothetical protein
MSNWVILILVLSAGCGAKSENEEKTAPAIAEVYGKKIDRRKDRNLKMLRNSDHLQISWR